MPTLNITNNVTIGGVSMSGQSQLSGENQVSYEPLAAVATGKAGTLTTRTDNDTGVATLSSGHGLITNDVVDVYWSGGVRYGMVATVATNAITVDGGAGDNLPAQDTAVVLCKQTVVTSFSFDGDNAVLIAISANRRAYWQFQDASSTVLASGELDAGEIYLYQGIGTNPVAGDDVAKLVYSNGDSTSTLTLKAGVLLDV